MCGIAVIASSTPVSLNVIRNMTELARHRGPNDEGYFAVAAPGSAPVPMSGPDTATNASNAPASYAPQGSIEQEPGDAVLAMGHRRLSILDLSVCGHQPMCTPDRRYWIVYNGEIYNYRELADELSRLGHRFASSGDTEVILAAYSEWGDAAFAKLNGMFAFVIYDAATGNIIAVRDRFGIKPLYYMAAAAGTVCFASEIKQFTAVPQWRAIMNTARCRQFLDSGLTDDGDETMFEGVFQIPPGALARVSVGNVAATHGARIQTSRWYELQPAPFRGSFEDAAAQCHSLLRDSVRLMLRSDAPVGSCLSGGIDSSSIVCIVNEELRRAGAAGLQRTFSARAEIPSIDEQPWIDRVVAATGVEAHATVPSFEGLQQDLGKLSWHQDEPVTSTSPYAQWRVFELTAGAGVKVMLDGQGADEAFAGYSSFIGPYLAGLVAAGELSEARREAAAINQRHGLSTMSAMTQVARVLAGGTSGVRTFSHAQLTRTNLPMLLRFEDRNAMAHSVEARVPFLDHRLVEFALGLPDAFKLGGGVTKRVLRAAMTGILPDEIRDRVDKIGFETPEFDWLRRHHAWFRQQLADAIEVTDRFIPASLLIHFDAMVAGTRPFDHRPWRAISFGQWMRAFAVATPSRRQSPT